MKTSKRFSIVALVLGLGLIGAACAQEEEADPGEAFEPGPLGAVEIGPEQPLKIGSIVTLSGDAASHGVDANRAIEIAIEDLGDEFRGHPIELEKEDDECLAEAGASATQRIISDPQIVAIIGTNCSGAAVPAAQIMSEAGLTMISGSNTSPVLTSEAGEEGSAHEEGYFRTSHNDEVQGVAAATFVREELGIGKVATVHAGEPYSQGLAGAFNSSFEELDREITLATAISLGQTDMRPVLTEIEASGAELIFFPLQEPEGGFVARQAQEFGYEGKTLMAADGLLTDPFVTIPETEGMYFSGPGTPTGALYGEFVAKYEDESGEKPIAPWHAHFYDATRILFEALEEIVVEENDGTLQIDRQELRDAVGATEGYEGVTGTLTCDEFGDCADPNVQIWQNTEEAKTVDQVRATPIYTFKG